MNPSALKRFGGILGILLTLILVASCSSSSALDSKGRKIVTLGLVTSTTGPLSGMYGQATVDAAEARIALANDTEEVSGIEIRLVVKDDQGTPAGAQAAVQALINHEKVHGIIDASAVFAAASGLTTQKNVPVFGWADGNEYSDPNSKNLFAYYGSPSEDFPPLGDLGRFFASQGAQKVCRLGTADVPAATNAANQFADSAKLVGLDVNYSVDVPRTVTDMSTYALAVKNSGCDSIIIITSATQSVALFRSLTSLDVKTRATLGLSYNQERLDPTVVNAHEGIMFQSQYQPFWMNTPVTKRVQDALAKYADWHNEAPAAGFHWGWMAADLATYALALPGAADSQRDLIDQLRKVTDYDAGGFICPVDFSQFNNVPAGQYSTCLWMSQIRDGHFVNPDMVEQPISLTE